MKLIDKAKSYTPNKRKERVFTQDELELFIALAKQEITLNQASNALNYEHSGTIYVNMTKAFIQLVQRGVIEFKPFSNTHKIFCVNCKSEMMVMEGEKREFCSDTCYLDFRTKLDRARLALLGANLFIKNKENEKRDNNQHKGG
jgi:hypothetical protein